ncbi:MAG: hydantoinase/oxoprolinase family protein [Pseudomonadota bacterium]
MGFRLGVDVGGTFTDLLLINEGSGETFTAKVPSTPNDSSVGVLNGVARICEESNIDPTQIMRVMHGTTVATNAVLTGRGAKVGLVTTAGYKQVLQVARSFCPGGLGGWVSYVKKPLLAPLELTIEANERMGADGKSVRALDEYQLLTEVKALKEKSNIEALTICFINAYLNGEHERQAKAIAESVFEGIPVSISSDVVPEMQEYERTETTVLNSYVRPEVSRYVENLQKSLEQTMGERTHLSILRSDGGLASSRAAADNPVNLLMSGPAGGVAGAIHFCKLAGHENILTFDMGGTSTDVALIQNAKARVRRETRVADVVVRAPSVDVRTVGAGGGSIAFVPELTKALRVGPESAGADPGPAAYMKGGEEPTVCDANVVLGYLPADVQLGGKMAINKDAAIKAVKKVADPMGKTVEEAAEGITKIANEAMFGALRLVSVEQGFDPREFALVGFGGAGPLHANALGILTNAWPTIIPPGPGVLCAYGDATTEVRDEASRTFVKLLTDTSADELAGALNQLASQASSTLAEDGIDAQQQTITFQADVRYTGQAFQLSIEFTQAELSEKGLDILKVQFDEEHKQLFTFALDEGHEIVMIRALATAKAGQLPASTLTSESLPIEQCKIAQSDIFYEGKKHIATIYDRTKLAIGAHVPGPAIVVEMDSTSLILPGFSAEVDAIGNLIIHPAN